MLDTLLDPYLMQACMRSLTISNAKKIIIFKAQLQAN